MTLASAKSCTPNVPRQHKYWNTWRQSLWPMPYLLRLQQVASVLSLSSSPFTHAPVVGYIAPAHTVFTPRHTGIEVLGASASTYAGPFATATGSFKSLPVVPTVYTCTCGGVHRAECLTPRKHKYWCTSRLRLQPLPDLLRLQQGVSHHNGMLHLRLS